MHRLTITTLWILAIVLVCAAAISAFAQTSEGKWEAVTLPQNFQEQLQADAPHAGLPKIPTNMIQAKTWRTNFTPRFFDETSGTTKIIQELIVIEHKNNDKESDYTVVTKFTEEIPAVGRKPSYKRTVLDVRRFTSKITGNWVMGKRINWRTSSASEVRPDNGEKTTDVFFATSEYIGKAFPQVLLIAEGAGFTAPPPTLATKEQ